MNPDALPLRDIHLPDAVSWWPLAFGWWLLLLLLAALVIAFVVRRRSPPGPLRIARAALQRQWRGWQQDKNAREYVSGLSQILRRMAIATDGREASAGLTGDAWLQRLNQPMQGTPFSTHPGTLLTDGLYRRDLLQLSDEEAAQLLSLCRERAQWFAQPDVSKSASSRVATQ